MGSCFSKKTTICSSQNALPDPLDQTKTEPLVPQNKKAGCEEGMTRKEIFVIKHRNSHEIDRRPQAENPKLDQNAVATASGSFDAGNNSLISNNFINGGTVMRASSCTKEEVDAILVQCGRLSRNSSPGKAAVSKHSGSKRSYDFDNDSSSSGKDKRKVYADYNNDEDDIIDGSDDDESLADRIRRYRLSRSSSSSSRRRTPSRERDGNGGGGRRVSRSPVRRSESPIYGANSTSGNTGANNFGNGSNKPGKMVSIPATVSYNGIGGEYTMGATIKRISVKRNVGDPSMVCRSASSPRSRSPAYVKTANQNQQQPLSLSRNNSKKAEKSPCKRNPLDEIDQNCIGFQQVSSQAALHKTNGENLKSGRVITQGIDNITQAGEGNMDNLQSQTITRNRTSRRLSRDLDLNPDDLLMNPCPSSYTALLLEDIQNFHQKSAPAFSLPPCVSKAHSIVEAVADLNSSTSSNLSSAFFDDRRRYPTAMHFRKNDDDNCYFQKNSAMKKRLQAKDPVTDSEAHVSDDSIETSFHKYVTVKRGTVGSWDMEEEESWGSNSYVGDQQHWVSSSWEPNSADSTGCCTSSRLNVRTNDKSPTNFQRHTFSQSYRDIDEA